MSRMIEPAHPGRSVGLDGSPFFCSEGPAREVRIEIFLSKGFCLHELSILADILHQARVSKVDHVFRSILIGSCPGWVQSSLGLGVAAANGLDSPSGAANVFILGDASSLGTDEVLALSWLRAHLAKGSHLFGVGDGTELLLRSGLLAGRTVAVHWHNCERWRDLYRETRFTTDLFVKDGPFVSCAGKDALIDMMMRALRPLTGTDHVLHMADQLNLERLRRIGEPQAPAHALSSQVGNETLQRALRIIHEHFHRPLKASDLARQCNVSQRQIQRLFRDYLGTTPSLYCLQWRLHKARALLARTGLSITGAAEAVGFRSVNNFSRRYASLFGTSPRRDRQEILVNHGQGSGTEQPKARLALEVALGS